MSDSILVYAEHGKGRIGRSTWEAIAAGQRLAAEVGAEPSAVVLGENVPVEELAAAELSHVLVANSPQLAEYTPEGYALALRQLISERRPRYVVFSHTYQVRDFAAKLAASLDSSFISDCLGYRLEQGRIIVERQFFQGKLNGELEFVGDPPYFLSFQAGSFREDAVRRGQRPAKVTEIPVDIPPDCLRQKPGERFREAKQAVDLSQAETIVAVGRGIKAPEHLELVKRLAEALGAEIGASRPICDSGWLPMDRQIGSSGQTVAPRLYVSLGISGAIQHQVGMKNSNTVVAINKDQEAPIFEVATYGVVGDLFEIVPALIEEVKKAKSG
jgi:electron transfer flavoprotein alpha subunit